MKREHKSQIPNREPGTANAPDYVIKAEGLRKAFHKVEAVRGLDVSVHRGELFGLLGPDGAGKTTTIEMLCGALKPTAGRIEVVNCDPGREHAKLRGRVGYMSQDFSLYRDLTVEENIDFFADLYRVPETQRRKRKAELLQFSRLTPFVDRLARQLSGGMKKKLALCCLLIYSPEVLFLDEPTTGVDPVSRRDFWDIVYNFFLQGMTIFVSTPYMDEAEHLQRVALMYQGKIIACDAPERLKTEPVSDQDAPSLEEVFISAIRARGGEEGQKDDRGAVPFERREHRRVLAIEASGLSKRFGTFTAVNDLDLEIKSGAIFGFLGANGAGKTTTIKMLCGILRPTSGEARVAGLDPSREAEQMKPRIGYMSQLFSLYRDLTARENLELYAGLYNVPQRQFAERRQWVLRMAGLEGKEDVLTRDLAGGWRQRLALGCAIMHRPEVVFLDEPTSGVDPISRRTFWDLIYTLSDLGMTVFVTTHYMDEAEHCDTLGLMHAGRLIATGSPSHIKRRLIKESVIEMEVSAPMRAQRLLSQAGRFGRVALFGRQLHIRATGCEAVSQEAKKYLAQAGIAVGRVQPTMASLEDAFIEAIERAEASVANGKRA